ncbi:MAG TPA: N-acetylmuramoyl-L-alanine amidase [Candidatus Obscuribacterales bacterium]
MASTTASSGSPPPATVAMSAHAALPVSRLPRWADRADRTPVKSPANPPGLNAVGKEARAIPQPAPPPSPALPGDAEQRPARAPEIAARHPILPAAATLATRTLSIRQPPPAEAQPRHATVAPPTAPAPVGPGQAPLAGSVPAGQSQTAPAASAAPSQTGQEPLASITVAGTGPVRVTVTGKAPLAYKTFRLHDPERYVLDIQGSPELAEISVPEPEPNPFVKKVRIGHPEEEPETVRIVLDLIDSEVAVREEVANGNQALAMIVEKAEPLVEDVHLPPGMSVVIDAGHGGTDPGAQRGDIKEKELTLAISDKLRKTLERTGVKVSMTRTQDATVSLEERVTTTNSIGPDAFVSVHINSLEANSSIKGIETYYQSEQSQELARFIHQSLVEKLQAPDRAVRKARFYVINHTPVPAVLAEVGFISNKQEREKLISSDYQQEIANGIARGVILYLSKRADMALSRPTHEKGRVGATKAVAGQEGDAKLQSLAQATSGPTGKLDSKQ